ncbi:carboxylate--amine ligase [Leptospira barantonii]|uniref:Carboxylate--amine ligase n=2 Tax=Leptospira barantonii TaxID=2023184 RepID=A0A5F2B4K9_9LEPT|nr:carboxylate--amine ligase [Leptospira barantonii]
MELKKLMRPEFWPAWLFYAPLVPYIVYLTIRHRGFGTICAANPGIPLGGLVGESKEQILKNLKSEHILMFMKVSRENGNIEREFEVLNLEAAKNKFKYPYILKPDAGQRGAGLKLVKNDSEVLESLKSTNVDLIAQEYHAGPEEAGIFYYRFPGENKGRIFSITQKTFPILEGNGKESLGELILKHPRFRYQWKVFYERHKKEWNTILNPGETKRLAEAGNHCQGTLFTDGSHLITEELTEKIDEISKTFSGFYFGRYDVRYRSEDTFKKGKEFGIVELNGITSESTNLYDPNFSIWKMYSILFKQWNLLFRIGSENRKRGIPKTSLIEIIRTLLRFYAGDRKVNPRSD